MKTTNDFKRFLSELTLGVFIVSAINPAPAIASATSDKVIYPLKQISKLECRFNNFGELSSDCIQDLPILNTKDYSKYATQDGGYNNYTRLYTVLWGGSYKYGWDVGYGGHIGTDIATAKGTPVYSMADGKVIKVKNDVMEGNMITIEHEIKGKKIYSNYMHLSKWDVTEGQFINVGTKIGEVGSTGNSTGNHLHFQIDLNTSKFHPYYYDYNACPYSYYKITEEGICFNELEKNTIDPLLFLETQGAILDSISTTNNNTPNTIKNTVTKTNTATSNTSTNNVNTDEFSIFDKTVYIGYADSDIRKVQEIFQKIGVYKGEINGKYEDIEGTILNYQLSNKIITDKNATGAGWFGPKTRLLAKQDYTNFLANGTNKNNTQVTNTTTNTNTVANTNTVTYDNKIETKKISKQNLMSREEIEKREVEDFLKLYKIELNFTNEGGNIPKDGSEILKLSIKNRKGNAFKGEMPGGMTFVVNTEKVTVFPEKLFHFTDGKRDIKLSGKQEGNTNLYIKIGNEVIKTLPLKVYNSKVALFPSSSKILSANSTILGSKQTGTVAFKDSNDRYMINLKYGSTYNIKASGNNKICIKQGSIKDIKKIYAKNCNDEDFKSDVNFTYDNTIGGLLVFDYKAASKDFNIVVKNNFDNKVLSEKKISVSNPKGLANTYAYKNEIIKLLEQGIATGINKGYFLEERGLSQKDGLDWIENSLIKIKTKVYDDKTTKIINNYLSDIKIEKQTASKTNMLTRLDFLNLSYKYLVFNTDGSKQKSYKDIDTETSKKLSKIFDEKTTWKDQFGQSYFRPVSLITRGEGAYLLSKTLEKNADKYLTLN